MTHLIDDLITASETGLQHGKLTREDQLTIIDMAQRLLTHVYTPSYAEICRTSIENTARFRLASLHNTDRL